MQSIDINCDLGEGVGNDSALMPWISSANIACGCHAGDEEEIKKTLALCLQHGVAVGAHPSYPDRKNFGRTNMRLSSDELFQIVTDQLHLIKNIAQAQGTVLHHVKPHGALYNMAAKDAAIAHTLAQAVYQIDPHLIFYGLSQSVMIDEAQKLNLKIAHEVFADRTYQPDGSLTPRTQPNALIADEQQAVHQAVILARQNEVTDVNGQTISLRADTICLHGDGEHALAFAKLIHRGLTNEGIIIRPLGKQKNIHR
ncbi:MAG: LamB/YcsF family protein [Bacteroidetes bacterium]|nr:LamB/YcsF family protein [Bacteroidota bacterium]MBS1539378.1 LamB/YcsF family protein [Bacteroidota bacterium]